MQSYSNGIKQTLNDTQSQLDKLHEEISKTLEKVASREKYINNQLEGKVQEYRGEQVGIFLTPTNQSVRKTYEKIFSFPCNLTAKKGYMGVSTKVTQPHPAPPTHK